MPIKPENIKLYPVNWKEISHDIIVNRADNKCEVCGVNNYSIGYWIEDEFKTAQQILDTLENTGIDLTENIPLEKKPIKIVLTVAHLDHNPANCDYDNLKSMCQRHHNRYDIKHRVQTRKNNKFKGMKQLI